MKMIIGFGNAECCISALYVITNVCQIKVILFHIVCFNLFRWINNLAILPFFPLVSLLHLIL